MKLWLKSRNVWLCIGCLIVSLLWNARVGLSVIGLPTIVRSFASLPVAERGLIPLIFVSVHEFGRDMLLELTSARNLLIADALALVF